MSNHSLSKSINKDICNAFDCYNNATETIDVSAGSFGKITLHVCKGCINKFQNKEEDLANNA